MTSLRVVRAEGDPFQRGRSIGRVLAEQIRRSAAYNLAHFARRGLDRAAIERLAGPLLEATRLGLPDELAALRGMAEGAGLPLLDVLVPNVYEELDPCVPVDAGEPPARAYPGADGQPAPVARSVERCSALTAVAPGVTLLGHNEQWLANEPAEIVLIVEVPDDPAEPAIVSPTAASWRPAVGMTAADHAQAVMSVTATDGRPGIPRVLVSRSALAARNRAEAGRRVAPEGRSGGYAYLHAFRGGQAFTVETSATRWADLDGPAVHANHYLDPDLAAGGAPASAGSLARQARLEELVAAAPPRTPEDVMAVLADHGSSPAAICLHADPAEGDDAEAVLFSMVCDLEGGRLWVAAGRPCEAPFQQFDLADLLAVR